MVVIIAIIAFLALGGLGPYSPLAPKLVYVNGPVVPSGTGTNAIQIIFTTQSDKTYSTEVSGGIYEINLPNLQTYTVKVQWAGGYFWQNGTVTLSSPIVIEAGVRGSSFTQSISFDTPTSAITVTGTVKASQSPQVSVVLFKGALNGIVYSAQVSGGAYSVVLPNEQNYSVQLQWIGNNNVVQTCNAQQYFLNDLTSTTVNAGLISC